MDTGRDAALPLRPLTVGELLDASVGVLRRCGWPLLAVGLILAALQQLVSDLAGYGMGVTRPDRMMPTAEHFPAMWIWLSGRLGMESGIIALLAAPAAAAAASAVLGVSAPPGPTGPMRWFAVPGGRWVGVVAIAGTVGAIAVPAMLFCGVPWLVWYGVTGLLVPTLVIDRATAGRVVPRAFKLVFGGACRAAAIRLLGYLGWLLVRLAVGFAGGTLVGQLDPPAAWAPLLVALPWILVNAVAFPALACLDACIHVENRIRTEGLDLALGRGDRAALEVV